MDEASEEAMCADLIARTGADSPSVARFFLEANAWDVELAVASYLESARPHNPPAPAPSDDAPTTVVVSDDDDDSEPEYVPMRAPPPPPGATKKHDDKRRHKKKKSGEPKRFGTIGALNVPDSDDDDEDDNDEDDSDEEGQAFYAGGSLHSGQQILGPPKRRDDIVSDMFRSVRQHGGLIVNREGAEGSSSSSSSKFSGTGYRLGATPDDTTVVPDPTKPKAKEPEPESVVVLRLWRNGFSLDNGELRPYEDPANAEFLQYVRRGEIPPELRSGPEVFLTMEDRRHDNFVKPTGPPKPFQGKGAMLGSPAPAAIGSTAVQAIGTTDQAVNQKTAQETLNVNENEPTTSIQFRLADGSRISGRFNHTHTIAQIREYITTAMPVYQLQNFVLLTTFPNKELTDLSQTIKDAGLLNALVVQRLK